MSRSVTLMQYNRKNGKFNSVMDRGGGGLVITGDCDNILQKHFGPTRLLPTGHFWLFSTGLNNLTIPTVLNEKIFQHLIPPNPSVFGAIYNKHIPVRSGFPAKTHEDLSQ